MSKTITLVEDDIDAAFILKKILVRAGYTVTTLPEGRAIVEDHFKIPDVFILDNYIPTIHGVALCKYLKLKSKTNKVPVIIISGSHHVEKRAKAAGAAFFLKKPFHADELLTHVNQLFSDVNHSDCSEK
jgi:DNA-binding response OmpR family regulator